MAQVPYYGSYYRFTAPPPEPATPRGPDPLSLLVIAGIAWWGWKKGWWTGKSHPRAVPPPALEGRSTMTALEAAA